LSHITLSEVRKLEADAPFCEEQPG